MAQITGMCHLMTQFRVEAKKRELVLSRAIVKLDFYDVKSW